jgi:hydroxyacylglutathione hydrolase
VITPLLSDSFESNTYIISGEIFCVVDPGVSASKFLGFKSRNNMMADALINTSISLVNTHCHFDHVGGNPGIISACRTRCFCHLEDACSLESGDDSMQLAGLFGREPVKHCVDVKVEDGEIIELGGVTLEVLHTPGHTPGGICLYEPETKSLFTGDTVFADSIGRFDFLGGNYEDLKSSIERILDFIEKRGVEIIYPGHGQPGTGDDIASVYDCFF